MLTRKAGHINNLHDFQFRLIFGLCYSDFASYGTWTHPVVLTGACQETDDNRNCLNLSVWHVYKGQNLAKDLIHTRLDSKKKFYQMWFENKKWAFFWPPIFSSYMKVLVKIHLRKKLVGQKKN